MGYIKRYYQKWSKDVLVRHTSLGILFNFSSVLFSVITISYLLEYMGKRDYGIWLTIFSICHWISYLDGGFGSGVRNELKFFLIKKDKESARSVITTGYISIFVFLLGLYGLIVLGHFFLDWNSVLGSDVVNFNLLALFVFGFYMLQLALKIIEKVYFCFDKGYLTFLLPMLANLGILITVIILSRNEASEDVFWNIAWLYTFMPLGVIVLASIQFFTFVIPEYAPKLKYFNKKFVKVIVKNGALFFLIQMSFGLLQSITPFFITKWFSPELTTEFQVSLKYYSVVIILLNIILQTMWASITETYTKGDGNGLRLIFKRKLGIAVALVAILVVMYFASNWIYYIWLGKDVFISNTINFAVFVFIIASVISRVFINFLNATNNIRIQAGVSITILIFYFPLIYALVQLFDLGVTSLIFTPVVFFFLQMVIALIEMRRIIARKV